MNINIPIKLTVFAALVLITAALIAGFSCRDAVEPESAALLMPDVFTVELETPNSLRGPGGPIYFNRVRITQWAHHAQREYYRDDHFIWTDFYTASYDSADYGGPSVVVKDPPPKWREE